MLKLQKLKDSQIKLSLREKERLFQPLFLKAFVLALMLHASAFFLFHIQAFKMDSLFVFTPTQVQSQKLDYPPLTLSQEIEENFPRFPIPLFHPSSLLSKQEIPLELNPIAMTVPFELLERRGLSIPQLNVSLPTPLPSLRLFVSGPLSQRKLLREGQILFDQMDHSKPVHHDHLSYKVQIEEKSGLVFWYEKIRGSHRPEIDKKIEAILLDLCFEPSSHLKAATGQIDFFLTSYD